MINITITAETPEELIQTFAKLALGSTALTPVQSVAEATRGHTAEEATAAPEAKPTRTRAAPKKEEPPADVVEEKGAPAPEPEVQPTTMNGASAEPPAKLDFDKEVAPKVLGYVRLKGKPWVEAILNEFGAARASDLNDEQLPELLATLAERGGPLP